jgi:hypothetical protein
MYINPFLAGVLVTIFAEISILFVCSLVTLFKKGKQHGN